MIRNVEKIKIFALLGAIAASPARANVVGNGTQNFAPATGFADFASVNTSQTLPKKSFHLGLFLNNASNTLPYAESVEPARQRPNQLTGADLVIGYGISERFHLAITTPFIVNQQIDDGVQTHSQFAETGNTELRLQGKFKLLGKPGSSGLAFILNATVDRTVENPHLGDTGAMSYIPELAADFYFGKMIFSANLGYRFHERGEEITGSLFEPFGNKILYSTALGVLINGDKTKLFIEAFGDRPVDEIATESDRRTNSLEALVGAKHKLKDELAVSLGAGSELIHGVATPDLRIFVGLNYLVQSKQAPRPQIARNKTKKHRRRPKRRPIRARMMPRVDIQAETIALKDLGLDNYNIPSTAPLPTAAPDEVIVINNVNFLYDSDHQVFRGGLGEIDKLAKQVSSHQHAKRIVIEGHTCSMGTEAYNEDLSFRRAKTIRDHLIKNYGFRTEQIVAVGFGESRPTASNLSEKGKRLNRRVEFKIYHQNTLTETGR